MKLRRTERLFLLLCLGILAVFSVCVLRFERGRKTAYYIVGPPLNTSKLGVLFTASPVLWKSLLTSQNGSSSSLSRSVLMSHPWPSQPPPQHLSPSQLPPQHLPPSQPPPQLPPSSIPPQPHASSPRLLPPPPPPSSNASSPSPDNSTRVLCVRFTGRLGNELFQYASTLGLALTLHRTPVFLGSQILPKTLKTFNHTASQTSRFEHRCRNSTRVLEESCCRFDHKLTRLDASRDVTVGLYLQSYRYFHKEVRQALIFTDDIVQEASDVLQELRGQYNASTLIGLHVRRGDMASEHNQQLGYPLASHTYLHTAMAFFRARHPHSVFVVASDSPQWVKENVPSGFHVHHLTERPPAVDMSVLSSLDHVIITFGTFSWWIGFLNAGTTVYMKDFIVNGTFIGKQFNPKGEDYVYPAWVPL